MTRKERLRLGALESCKWRGHVMNRFNHNATHCNSTCKKCGMHVSVTPYFSYEIIGEAVALNCKG